MNLFRLKRRKFLAKAETTVELPNLYVHAFVVIVEKPDFVSCFVSCAK